MATIPTPEAIFHAVYQSLCGSDYGSVPKKKYTTGRAELKSQIQKTKEILDGIFRALKLDDIDEQAKESAQINIMNAAMAYKEVEISTFTFEASQRQIIWDLLGYLYVPGVARILANWNLEEPMDKDMPSGRFWYLPEVEGTTLKLPVAQVVDWYLDLLGMPLEKFAAERMEGLADADDNTSESMIRSLYNWKKGTLPTIDILDAYFPDEMAIKYKGTFELDAGLNEDEQFAKALEFVAAKSLAAEALQMEINISDLSRIQQVLDRKADSSERCNFVDKLEYRYAAPSPARIRQRLLIARMVQDGYTRLRKLLLPDVSDNCADPEVNKLVQLIQQFGLIYYLTKDAFISQGEIGEHAENLWFEKMLKKSVLLPESILSILPSQRDRANVDLGKILSRRFQTPLEESSLPNLLYLQSDGSPHDARPDQQGLSTEVSYDQLIEAAKTPGRRHQSYITIFQNIFALNLSDHQFMEAGLEYLLCIMAGNHQRSEIDAAFDNVKNHPYYKLWKGPFLHLEGKHLINCNDFEGAITCFRGAETDCLNRNYARLRGQVAKDLFATEIANQRLNVNNHRKYYRDIINFGTHGGAELASVEELAAHLSEYFRNELYQPYTGVPSLRRQADKEAQDLLRPIGEFIWKADSKGLEKWVKKNRQRLQKHLPDVHGDTALSLLIKMWNGFRANTSQVPFLLQAQIPTAFRTAISTISTTAPKLLKMVDFKGQTPLMLIAEQGEAKVVKIMIEAGADPAAQDYRGRSALHAAIMNGHQGVIDILLEHPECATKTTNDGRTPAHSAIAIGDIHSLELLLSIAPSLVNADSISGTPMVYANAAANNHQLFIKEFGNVPHRPGFRPATKDELVKCLDLVRYHLA